MQLFRYAVALILIGILASLTGFYRIAVLSDDLAKLLLLIFAVLFIISIAQPSGPKTPPLSPA